VRAQRRTRKEAGLENALPMRWGLKGALKKGDRARKHTIWMMRAQQPAQKEVTMRHRSVKDENNAWGSLCMYTYLRNIGPLFFMEFFFSQKFESLIVSFDGSFRSYLLESYLVILTSMRGMTSTYFFVHKPLSEGLSASPNIFCFLRRRIMESALCVLVDCPIVWSCLQVFNLGFPWGWGYMEEDLVIYKELFSQRTFGISKLF